MTVRFTIFQALAKKEARDGRRYTYRDIYDATKINLNSVSGMMNNTQQQVYLTTLDRLCDFLECDISDLLVREGK